MRTTLRAFALLLPLGVLVALAFAADDERPRLDGRWKATYTTSPTSFYEMEFSGNRFHATQDDAWYKGELVVDLESDPARLDFVIRECECGFLGKASTGIFRWDGDQIELRAPQPGDPRPTAFDEKSGETMRLVRQGE